MHWLLDELRRQGAVIKDAPFAFLLAWAIGLVVLYLILRWLFQDRLKAKDDLIGSLKEKLALSPATSVNGRSEKWLDDIAEQDRLELHDSVLVASCVIQEWLTGDDPRVLFRLYIRNFAVYAITVDPNLAGFIAFNERRLNRDRTLSTRLPHNLPHRGGDSFEILQELTEDDAVAIREDLGGRASYYDFGKLHITIPLFIGSIPIAASNLLNNLRALHPTLEK